jgi:hypothetical protein
MSDDERDERRVMFTLVAVHALIVAKMPVPTKPDDTDYPFRVLAMTAVMTADACLKALDERPSQA